MFTPKLNKRRSIYQTPVDGSGGSLSRGRAGAFTPNKNIFTPTGQKSLNSSVLQASRVYEESGQHRLEAFGPSLPILVTEALALKEKNVEPSVKISPSGWAWLVCGRRLLVWVYKSTASGKMPPCHELSLPPCSLPNKSDLVSVVPYASDPNLAMCLAATPDGTVRFWNNIAHESSFVEITSELKGEECAAVTHLESQTQSYVLATTSSSLVLVMAIQNTLKSRVLRPPQGMLKGISRRMSSFIFGSGPVTGLPTNFHCILPGEVLDEQFSAVYVLCGEFLQKWAVSAEMEKLLYQCPVEQFVKDCLSHELWQQEAAGIPGLQTWILDMEVSRDGVVILAAGVNTDVSKELFYCIGMLHTEGSDSPRSFLSFTVVPQSCHYVQENEKQLLSYKLLMPNPTSPNAFLHENRTILCTSVTSSQQSVDKLEFYAGNDRILGAGQCDHTAIFFSSTRGMVSVKSTTAQMEASISEAVMMDTSHTAPMRLDQSVAPASFQNSKLEELSMSEDVSAKLQAAFLHSIGGNVGQAQQIVDELFPPGVPSTEEAGAKLDRAITQLSMEMISDFPASDPRWAESETSVGSAMSLILVHQLEDKLKAHEYLIQFLKSVNLWDRLGKIPVRNTVMQTNMLLCEHAEKLVAAKTLREQQAQHQELIDQAIANVLKKRDTQVPASGLTASDVFYREVGRIQEILEALVNIEEENLLKELSPRETVHMVTTINSIIGGMLVDAVQYRQMKADMFQVISQRPPKDQNYVPWTAADELEHGGKGTRSLLGWQHNLTCTKGISEARDSQERGTLFQQLLELTGLILDGYRTQLEVIKMSNDHPTTQYRDLLQKYESERTTLITPFVQQKQYDRAASLAEKYMDFLTLIQICEETDNQERLQRYMTQFQSGGFADYVFKFYLEKGKRGKLMTSSLSSHPQLGRFLQAGENKFMSWLHDIASDNFLSAHRTLYELGVEENNSAAKKKTLLSLSKLAALATDDPPEGVHNNLEVISDELDLLLNQEELPADVVQSTGFTVDNMKVFSPKELIGLYVGEANSQSNEFDFKKALDLLSYVGQSDPEYTSLLQHIWIQSILKDDWSNIKADDHLSSCRDTIFFRTVELAHTEGYNLKENLPNAGVILGNTQLQHLKDDAHFQFLVKASFEQIHRVLSIS